MKKVFFLTLLLLVPSLSAAGNATAADFSSVVCPSETELVRELIELQIAGVRVPGRKDACVEQAKFPHVLALPPPAEEAGRLPDLKYVSETKPFEIRSIKNDGKGQLEVEFVYYVFAKGKSVAVEDYLVVRRYEGFGKKYYGCGAAMLLPRHLVIRKSCHAP